MYENLLGQEQVTSLLEKDIQNKTLPGSILFYGNAGNGKLTAALETARILSHKDIGKGNWQCNCPLCLQHKSLVASNVLLCGPRDTGLEISASCDTFLRALRQNNNHLYAARYLFVRAVRKLTMRFSPVLLAGDDKLSKIASLVSQIDENLELIDFPHELPPVEKVEKICNEIKEDCESLESGFFYTSIPVSQIRNIEAWARITTDDNKKTVIIENADCMNDAARNALLKILEEPPKDTVFILLTSRRNAVMPTILSRVRTYNFQNRTLEKQTEVLERAFHTSGVKSTINDYMQTFLPVPPFAMNQEAQSFIKGISSSSYPNVSEIVKRCKNFTPKIEYRIFLNQILLVLKPLLKSQMGTEAYGQCLKALQRASDHVNFYNQSIQASLENLLRDLTRINISNGNIFKCSVT